jgi:hypothetical protein
MSLLRLPGSCSVAPALAPAPAQVIPTDDVISVPSTKKMMRDKHDFTGDVNIQCKAYHRCYDRQFLRRNITGRQISNTLHGVHRDPFFFSATSREKSQLLVPQALNPEP